MKPDAMDLKSNTRHPWGLAHQFARASWMVVWALFGRGGPRALSPWRILLLRLFGADIGRGVLVCSGVKVLLPWNLRIENYTAIGEGVDIYNYAPVHIGANTCVSQRVWLCTGTHDYNVPSFPLTWDAIRVGSGVWIAAECFVAPGVTIGDGAVVGARSVVTRDLGSDAIYAGNPCVLIKPRRRA
ncbi:MAG: putative colanic acid biosynthesis acetyltransferase [Variovorax sp.]|nr:MAG: putative colanic acid biosynthesis acetyltransferase [Variovorax sp.]